MTKLFFNTFVMALLMAHIAAGTNSRFLLPSDNANPRAISCKKNPAICSAPGTEGPNCCKNKCVDVVTDKHNCGSCGVKCKYTEACCRGQCVIPWFDKRHCGRCNNRCKTGDYCIYGLCRYV